MADISFDCSASNLLCTETNLCFDALDSVTTDDQTHQTNNQNLGLGSDRSEPLIGLPLLSEESFYLMIERERQHLPGDDYLKRLRSGGLDLGVRREAFDWIWKVGEPKFVFEGIDFLEFSSSEIAAAVAISVSADIHKAVSSLIHVEKGRVLKCVDLIQDLELVSGTSNVTSFSSVPQSPIGVLDAACLSYKSDELTVGSCANSSHSSPDTKRRKLDTPSQEEHIKS
ncbi:similar to CYCLIN D4;1 [Actinidia rufa]|uniref:Similar to CYCLIN D41 n=1 Tax=Actinidia rufa TaxID=165716 RepID=A0A7J0F5T6_9ERIC|nr:similar to CYCLIN D4;1 [Actinidia rufa]